MGLPEQDIIMMPLLIGTDGKKKMSKSLDNYIGISEKPEEQFGKIMSISDDMISDYWKLCIPMKQSELQKIKNKIKQSENLMEVKLELAKSIVALYHDTESAKRAEETFIKTFSKQELPNEIPIIKIDAAKINIIDLLVETNLVDSKSEARRMIKQNAIKIDQNLMDDIKAIIKIEPNMVIQVGKRKFVKISD